MTEESFEAEKTVCDSCETDDYTLSVCDDCGADYCGKCAGGTSWPPHPFIEDCCIEDFKDASGAESFEADFNDSENKGRFSNITCSWCNEPFDGTEVHDDYRAVIVHLRCAKGDDYDAESFEAECSICNTQVRTMSDAAWIDDDGECVCMDCMVFEEDFQGKPYTGKINPNDPDFDAVKADRNKDNKLSSWERAVGNQVARSMRVRKGDRRFLPRRSITEVRGPKRGLFGSIGPLAIIGIGVAYYAGNKYLKN